MQNTAIINEILFEHGYLSPDDALKDWSVMIALSRIDLFRAEKESFENKYKNHSTVMKKISMPLKEKRILRKKMIWKIGSLPARR